MSKPLDIVVGGYIVGLPLAGMTWHHLHYLLGLHRLGHRVTFLEDSGPWLQCFDPDRNLIDPDPTYGIAYLRNALRRVGLPERFCYVSRHTGPGELTHFGMTESELHDEMRQAHLYIAVSGVTSWHDSRPRPKRCLAIDTDPVYTQATMLHSQETADDWRSFDRVASFGTRIGTDGCDVPKAGLDWHPTRQPVVLDVWPHEPPPAGAPMTTLGRWEHDDGRHVEINGKRLKSSKAAGWQIIRDVAGQPDLPPVELAMDKMPTEERRAFERRGWSISDPIDASRSLDAFETFLSRSLGELTPAKEIYAATNCGWFSDRAACYLASGRPIVTQDTGFARGPLALPTGDGLLTWTTADEAAAALRSVAADPDRHHRAARALVDQHLAHDRVLPKLVDFAMS